MTSDLEKENVDKLRSLVEDINPDLTYFDLLRWLQGYDNNFDAIVPKLRVHLNLMKSWDVKSFKCNQIVLDYFATGFLGNSGKDNNLVYLECSGRTDIKGLYKSVSFIDFLMCRIVSMEHLMNKLREQEQLSGKQSKFIWIVDYEFLKIDKDLIKFLTGHYKNFCHYFVDHYVEVFDKFVAVNVPSFAPKIWNVIKVFIPEKTKNKIAILGSNWKTDILQYVDASVLPVHWGGTLVDPDGDPMCPSKVLVPNKVPAQLFWKPGANDYTREQLTCFPIPAGRVEFISFKVDTVDTELSWYFYASSSFNFGIFFTEDEQETDIDNMEIAFPDFGLCADGRNNVYAEGTTIPESGKIRCKKAGYYKVRFNNYPAWFTTLKVHYRIYCTVPKTN